ncbi:P27 family phage terminase small subunit [Brevibacterium gallinarum]|uniref:P27 family phage terminase small subunit n=1 Tax=Brevibacterium gallinarum TaxID=2762220 RepID=A0ABR8WQM1_9MICO|nr:P27 family phage terminase small subunit [Brevibacterium gallinarum]MBD8019379.1 P27 family phage terminase small subunit [Brevibacterium gallinarum]
MIRVSDWSAPDHLPESVAEVWNEVIAAHPKPARIIGPTLEAFCYQVSILRDAQRRIGAEGLVVADEKGRPVPHPALGIAKDAQNEVRKWGAKFQPPVPARRRAGPMYDETVKSVTSAKHLVGKDEYAGPVAAVKTLAWLIDEAQRAGIEELQKASFGTIPTYLKACEALQITPASVPVPEKSDDEAKSKKSKLAALQGGLSASGA